MLPIGENMKPDTIVLHTTDQEFQDGHLFADKGRGKNVQIRRDQLVHLLMDHSNMIARLNKLGIYPVNVKED